MDLFYDRYGNQKIPAKNDIVRPRKSIHIVVYCQDKILVLYPPYAKDSPELPGGGIENGEELINTAKRELQEETGLIISNLFNEEKQSLTWTQDVNFYAEDVKEFWYYHMTFWLLKLDDTENWQFDQTWINRGGEKVSWKELSEDLLADMQYFHKNAVKYFMGCL